jgi:Alpha-2-macroglobulin bait region domain
VKLNQKIKFRVGCKEKMKRVTYNVIGRGNILLSQTLDMGSKFQQTIEIDVTQSMAPNSSFVVHYITDDGMLISDQTDFQVAPTELTNPVSEIRVFNANFLRN